MKEIIGVAGWINSGKGTAGDWFVNERGYSKDSFANSLKDCLASIFNWDRNLLEGSSKESRIWREKPDEWWETRLNWKNHPGSIYGERFTPRVAMQYIGTQLFRNSFEDNIWVNSLESRLLNKDKIVITDCRFKNELDVIKRNGGLTIWVVRGELPEWYDIASKANNGDDIAINTMISKYSHIHESEWKWVGYNFDHIVYNDGSLMDFYNTMENILKNHISKK